MMFGVTSYQTDPLSVLIFCMLAVLSSGCASESRRAVFRFESRAAVTIPYEEGWLGRPVIEGSINGVRGKFLIDTGANEPVLTMKAIRRCGIPLSHKTKAAGFAGNDALHQLRLVDGDVSIEIQGARLTWGNVPILSGLGSDEWFGLIDYHTLKAAHAIINLKERTITLSP